uniref:Uncharacterized protein n=1 Tax=Arundo donax TaxID=35708 RepID=A0A0A9F9S2_ARUDO
MHQIWTTIFIFTHGSKDPPQTALKRWNHIEIFVQWHSSA